MIYYIKIQNLASGDLITAKSSAITKYDYNKTMNWETTPVIGRMDPIYNFRNTESKIEVGMNPSKVEFYKFTDSLNETELNNFFENQKEKTNITTRLEVYDEDGVRSFFYPSYQQNGNSYQLKSAPIFRCYLANSSRVFFDVFCTIPSFSFNQSKYIGQFGTPFYTGLNFTLNVIHTSPESVGSRYFNSSDLPVSPLDEQT
jgi:hypothetical protein